jgi:hypothetical protein
MIFPGIDEQKVELKITNYQFPNNSIPRDYDSNWLHIYLSVKSKLGDWQTIDPSLLTWEVEEIIKWLDDLSKQKVNIETSIEFIEPNLSFEFIQDESNEKIIRIKFNLESRPKSAKDEIEYYVDCRMTCEQLKQAANELSQELSKFPQR